MAVDKPPAAGMGDGVGELPVTAAKEQSDSDLQEHNSEKAIKTEKDASDGGKQKKESQGSIGDFGVCSTVPIND